MLIKKHLSFVFILEGYDERDCFKNLYQTNSLDEWRCQVITTCRSQSLLNRRDDHRSYFSAGTNEKLAEIILCPFTEKEIKNYIEAYVKQHQEHVEWDATLYWNTLSQLPAVLALVTNPFVLKMTVLALPDLVKKYGWDSSKKIDDKENPLLEGKKMALTQAELYDAFIDAWFARQIKKLGKQGSQLTVDDFFQFNQEIASQMLRNKTKYLEVKERAKEEKPSQEIIKAIIGISRMEEITISKSSTTDWQQTFFDEKNTLLRSGWLLRKVGARTYTFLHDSLRAHFAAKDISHGILAHSSFALGHPLNEQLLVDQPDLLDSMVDRLKNAPDLETLLFDLIDTSKHDPLAAIGAANAITILNRAGIAFSGRDFSRVRIAGADLSGAFLTTVNFFEADLRNVQLMQASLTGVNFTGACLDGIQFGQLPLLRFQNGVMSCAYSSNGQWLAVGDDKGYIYLVDAPKRTLVATLKNWSFGRIDNNPIYSLCFDPASRILAVGSSDSLIRLWNVSTKQLIATWQGHTSNVKSVAFSPDGKTVASGSSDNTVRLWEVASGKALQTLQGHTDRVNSIAFSPDGKTVASGS